MKNEKKIAELRKNRIVWKLLEKIWKESLNEEEAKK